MDKAIAIGDTPLRLVLRALILGPGQINGHIPSITETHVAESAILVGAKKSVSHIACSHS